MRGLFRDLLVALLAVSGLMSPAVMAGEESTCSPVEIAKLIASDVSSEDGFGHSVSISGTIAVIGSRYDQDNDTDSGSAYIFEQQEDGNWLETAKLLASDGENFDHFGNSVAISGATALIGAYRDDDNGSASGSAYIFEQQDDGSWLEVAKLTASDGASGDRFGESVAISGTTALIGAHFDNDNGGSSGSAYIFEQQEDGSWMETAKLLASDGDSGDSFGWSVSISGTTALVGNYSDGDNGSVYVFGQQEDGMWLQTTKLTAPDGKQYDNFGYSVSISENDVIVGAIDGSANGSASGSAYIFQKLEDGTWSQTAKLLASNGSYSHRFGCSVSISGSTAVIGAYGSGGFGKFIGSAYIFKRQQDGAWVETAELLASDGESKDFFGYSVAITGTTALIGSNTGQLLSGNAYLFNIPDATDCNGNGICDLDDIANGTSQDCNSNGIPDECDIADGTSGDLNGNGIPDECLICEFQSTFEMDNYGTSNGHGVVLDGKLAAVVCDTNGSTDDDLEVQFFKLNGTSWLHEATLPLPQASATYYPRKPIAISGDYAIAGFASAFDPFPVAIYHRDNGDWIQQASLQPTSSNQYFALSVDISGDTAVVGSPRQSGGQAIVYRRAGDFWYLEATLMQPGDQESEYFGSAVAIDDDTILVGSLAEGAWAFERSGNTWSFVERIQSETDNSIGCSIDLDGDVAVMGSYHNSPERTIVVFRRDSTGHWMEEQELTTTIPVSPPLGFDVRISGDTILTNSGFDFSFAGARDSGMDTLPAQATNSSRGDDDGLNSSGNAHLFSYEDGLWREIKVLSRPELPDAYLNSPFIALSDGLALAAFIDEGGYQFSNIDWFTTKASEIDCNFNQICDELDLILGTSRDCDENGTLDECDIEGGLYVDVDLDGIPDVCESDCNGNLVPDDSELEQGLELDCNGNDVPDSCDISIGLSPDGDGDGIPDECDTSYIINVSADGSGLFADLQDAMNLVLPGGTIQVSAGMYGPISLPPHSLTLVGVDGAQSTFIQGGDGQTAMTIVDGDHDDTVVDGFTLTGGQAAGGGLLISGSNPTIRNCIVTMNESIVIGGGGLVLSAAPVFESCHFISNSAILGGGGLAIAGRDVDGGACMIEDCLFEANSVTNEGTNLSDSARGGGLFASDANVDILDSKFLLNTAPYLGGGLDLSDSTSMLVSGTVFSGNDTSYRGRSIASIYNTPGPEVELSGNSLCQNDGNGTTSDYIIGNWTDLGDNLFGSDCDADGVCDFEQPAEDCNSNGNLDSCDVAFGNSEDENNNGIPDECECPDTNGDGFIGVNDVLIVIDAWGNCVPDQDCPADVDGDGLVNVNDILLVISEWGVCK